MIEPIRLSFEVDCPPDRAFEVWTARINVVGIVASILIFLGYVSIPAAVLAGVVK